MDRNEYYFKHQFTFFSQFKTKIEKNIEPKLSKSGHFPSFYFYFLSLNFSFQGEITLATKTNLTQLICIRREELNKNPAKKRHHYYSLGVILLKFKKKIISTEPVLHCLMTERTIKRSGDIQRCTHRFHAYYFRLNTKEKI